MKSDLELRKKFQAKEFPLSAKYDPYLIHKHEMVQMCFGLLKPFAKRWN
jgi:hypothetical protein